MANFGRSFEQGFGLGLNAVREYRNTQVFKEAQAERKRLKDVRTATSDAIAGLPTPDDTATPTTDVDGRAIPAKSNASPQPGSPTGLPLGSANTLNAKPRVPTTKNWEDYIESSVKQISAKGGSLQDIQAFKEYAREQRHRGLNEYMTIASQALKSGDLQTAKEAAIRAYSFLPNGSSMQVMIQNGELIGTTWDEKTGDLQMATKITPELLDRLAAQVTDPAGFRQAERLSSEKEKDRAADKSEGVLDRASRERIAKTQADATASYRNANMAREYRKEISTAIDRIVNDIEKGDFPEGSPASLMQLDLSGARAYMQNLAGELYRENPNLDPDQIAQMAWDEASGKTPPPTATQNSNTGVPLPNNSQIESGISRGLFSTPDKDVTEQPVTPTEIKNLVNNSPLSDDSQIANFVYDKVLQPIADKLPRRSLELIFSAIEKFMGVERGGIPSAAYENIGRSAAGGIDAAKKTPQAKLIELERGLANLLSDPEALDQALATDNAVAIADFIFNAAKFAGRGADTLGNIAGAGTGKLLQAITFDDHFLGKDSTTALGERLTNRYMNEIRSDTANRLDEQRKRKAVDNILRN